MGKIILVQSELRNKSQFSLSSKKIAFTATAKKLLIKVRTDFLDLLCIPLNKQLPSQRYQLY